MRREKFNTSENLRKTNNEFKPSQLDNYLEKQGFRQTEDKSSLENIRREYTGSEGEHIVISLTETLEEDPEYEVAPENENLPGDLDNYLIEEGFERIRTAESQGATYQNSDDSYNINIEWFDLELPTRRSAEESYPEDDQI